MFVYLSVDFCNLRITSSTFNERNEDKNEEIL